MPKRTDLQSILILGSGPIVVGQRLCAPTPAQSGSPFDREPDFLAFSIGP
jgi:hypothetical protein